MKNGYEIKRKFLLDFKSIPVPLSDSVHIEQYYISKEPEIRLRKEVVGYGENRYCCVTIKTTENELVRNEFELEIPEHEYYDNQDKKIPKSKLVEKRRYLMILEDNTQCYVDDYKNKNLTVVEVEFDSVDDANSWTPSKWFGKEVTGVKEYKNINIAMG